MMQDWIFRLCWADEWTTFQADGGFAGNAGDVGDGFLHFSAAHQVAGTAARHYAAVGRLLLLAVPVSAVGDHLKWETSRDGQAFPHLYATLAVSDVAAWRDVSDRDFEFLRGEAPPLEAEGWTCIL